MTTIRVGRLLVPDAAPLHRAIQRGYFAREGLEVKVETIQGAALAVPQLKGESMDFSMLNYVTAVQAQSQGAADLRVVSDGYQAAPGTFALMVMNDSDIKGVADLKGRTLAVPTLKSIATLSSESALIAHGLTQKDVNWREEALPDMVGLLQQGKIDAAWMTEPFISLISNAGARQLYDVMTGPMDAFPIAGWGCTEKYAREHPDIVAAFQRAMHAGQLDLAADRKAVVDIIPTYIEKIPPEIAGLISLGTYPTTLEAKRLQRVADSMHELGYTEEALDMNDILLPMAPAGGTAPATPPAEAAQ
ncbi:sulfonate ABC transporter substrate-binding protein [Microtetraspora sp. NBRC 13810]|uniref:ABC transporter substrate-binding protein n=1 Tax=Microtetraspora sp. NBRC 13810 TaxID=3030990 RepID=UPI0024A38CFF|nr:ABC transporter substrate-binding protein [Microtetraspora sp. NBRC 13810]GLW09223.1 sulfonate ABC transporter substrate-binding protein [Microtetraspora sp. NBRC 13810]